jgi:hypothetical protein
MLAVELNGGLGNQLFQLSAGETIAAETGRTFCIVNSTSPKTVHTDRNYFTTVLKNWASYPHLPHPYKNFNEPSFAKYDWSGLPSGNVRLTGYFQNWRYVPSDFTNRICLPQCAPLEGAFLHIRGGDYVDHWLHDVRLHRSYYRRAIEQFPTNTHFYIFTNDKAYAKGLEFLNDISHTYVESDEEMALAQMVACKDGGICANSTFSWWGAYLNPRRRIVMPDRWFNTNGFYTDGYYFPEVIRVPV